MLKKQYASQLRDYSSEYGGSNSVAYVVFNILGEPRCYPAYGDFTEACVFRTYGLWWKMAPEYPLPLPNLSKRFFTTDDFIEVQLKEKVYIQIVNIYETYNPGAVTRILALDVSLLCKYSQQWFVMWESEKRYKSILPSPCKEATIFSPLLRVPPFPANVIRIEFIHDKLDYYTELDAVEVIGETEADVDSTEPVTSLVANVSLDDFNEPTPKHIAVDNDNGLFDLLPGEVIFHLLSYLSLEDLSTLSTVSTLFQDHCYNPLLPLHQHLNLKPYWFRVNENSLEGFVRKCRKIKSLNLSWCGGHNGLLESDSLIDLVKSETLTRLELSCCPVSDETFKKMMMLCTRLQELDVSSTQKYLTCSSLQTISWRRQLTRLNLSMTTVDTSCLIVIIKHCNLLETLNIGSCSYVQNCDQVAVEVAANCPNIKHLEFWRAKTLTSDGLLALAMKASQLVSLDIGWCSKVYGQEGNCLVKLAEGCSQLKKLFLTANRSISDNELQALAKHCPKLEQLDILGNRSVSKKGIHNVLRQCKNLIFLDVSFCTEIDEKNYEELKKLFPNCKIKKSFAQ